MGVWFARAAWTSTVSPGASRSQRVVADAQPAQAAAPEGDALGAGPEEGSSGREAPLVPPLRVRLGHWDPGVLRPHGCQADLVANVDHRNTGVGGEHTEGNVEQPWVTEQ
jgi:hypothetical protein